MLAFPLCALTGDPIFDHHGNSATVGSRERPLFPGGCEQRRRVQLVRRDGRDVSTLYGREGGGGEGRGAAPSRERAENRDFLPTSTLRPASA